MRILGIETSCDETAVSVIEVHPVKSSAKGRGTPEELFDRVKVLSNIVSSQVKLHAKYGGVVPSLAAREHAKNIEHVFNVALKDAKIKDFKKEIDLISVTIGPGLEPALLVGIRFAKELAKKYQKPITGVNHLEGHIYSNWLPPIAVNSNFKTQNSKKEKEFPILNLIVSGGHTELVLMKKHGDYKIIGETLDDAVGEAFDKVARLLGLGYPGGPVISKLALNGNPDRYPLPSPMIHAKNFDFSFSGLKTAVLYLVRDLTKTNPSAGSGPRKISSQQKADIASSFQKSAVEVLVKKTIKAAMELGAKTILLSGGVSANKYLRETLAERAKRVGLNYSQPEMIYTTDNAVMIAAAGYFNYKKKKSQQLSWSRIEMDANLGF